MVCEPVFTPQKLIVALMLHCHLCDRQALFTLSALIPWNAKGANHEPTKGNHHANKYIQHQRQLKVFWLSLCPMGGRPEPSHSLQHMACLWNDSPRFKQNQLRAHHENPSKIFTYSHRLGECRPLFSKAKRIVPKQCRPRRRPCFGIGRNDRHPRIKSRRN